MQTIVQVPIADLRGTEAFDGIADEGLKKIAGLCTQKVYEAGEYCAVRGDKAAHLLIVTGGKAASEVRVDTGKQTYTVTIAHLTKGHLGAWSAIVPPHSLTSSLRCVEKTTIVSIAASDLKRVFAEDPSIERIVMTNLAFVIGSRLRDSQVQLQRLVVEILKQGTPDDGNK